jgi:diguanylate cyclase (GGDEF)-like protein
MHDRIPADVVAAHVTQNMSSAFKRTGRVSDAVGRLGQTEFAVVAPSTEASGAIRMVERLQTALDDAPMAVNGSFYKVKIRAGYCAVPDFSESPVDAVEMLVRAATALREGRTGGEAGRITAFNDASLRLVQ